MSRESWERFFKFLMENQECQAKVKSFGGDVDALAAYARELGYDFSPEELREHHDKALLLLKSRMQKKLKQPDASLSSGAREFYALIKLTETDGEVAKRLAELGMDAPEELIAYGKEKGFTFSKQDLQSVGKNILEPSDELSDEELEMAAGGAAFAFVILGICVAGVVAVAVSYVALGVALLVGQVSDS